MKFSVNALKRLITVPLRMNRRQALTLIVLLAIFAGALYLRLSVTLGYELPLGRDGPYHFFHVEYLLEHWPVLHADVGATHQLFFHFAVAVHVILSPFGTSLTNSFNIVTALGSGLVVLTTFLMMRRLTKNIATALAASFFAAFIPASFRMMGELQKNAFGVTLAPLFVFFLWRGLESGKKLNLLVAGIALGVVGLTHELVFGTLVITYICYLAFLLAYRRRIPWCEIKAAVIIAVPVALICGAFYVGMLNTVGGMAGWGKAAVLMAQADSQQPLEGQPMVTSIYRFYDEYIGQLLLVFASIGAGVAAYRRKATDLLLLTWGMSALIMAQDWIVGDYQWRFAIMLATPVVLLAAVGLVEGVGALLLRAGKNFRALLGKGNSEAHKIAVMVGRAVFLCLLLFIVVQQARVSYIYAWTGEQLQPTITMDEYNALQKFHQQVCDAYAFGSDERFIYWLDVVGLKGSIQGGDGITHLSYALRGSPGGQSDAIWLATEWYREQQQLGENIYALAGMGASGGTQILENEQLFELIFNQSSLRAYALNKNFSPPENYHFSGYKEGDFALDAEHPPPGNQQPPPVGSPGGAPSVLKILLAPVYLFPGAARFVIGVPLTILLWVFPVCLMWEAIRKTTSGEKLEKLRKCIIVGGVVVLTLAVLLLVRGFKMPMGPGPGLGPEPSGASSGFELVKGDRGGWILMSAVIEGEVSGPSWFGIKHLGERLSPRCRQFQSLESARNNVDPLGSGCRLRYPQRRRVIRLP